MVIINDFGTRRFAESLIILPPVVIIEFTDHFFNEWPMYPCDQDQFTRILILDLYIFLFAAIFLNNF